MYLAFHVSGLACNAKLITEITYSKIARVANPTVACVKNRGQVTDRTVAQNRLRLLYERVTSHMAQDEMANAAR